MSPAIRALCAHRLAPLVLLALLWGCGDRDAPPRSADAVSAAAGDEQPPGENPYLAAGDLCALVPVADVAAAVGGTEPLSSQADETPPVSCDYAFRVPHGSGTRQASAELQMLSDYGLERLGVGEGAAEVDGLGDEAWVDTRLDTYLLFVRRGDLVFSVHLAGGGQERWPQMARAMAQVVLARL